MIEALGSCVATAIISCDAWARQVLPALWLLVYGCGVILAASEQVDDTPRAFVVAALSVVCAATVSVGQERAHRHIAVFVFIAHATCTFEHLLYDGRAATLVAVGTIDVLAFAIVLYSRWAHMRKSQ